jgi:hypothetical protein
MLPADRQTPAVPHTPVAMDVDKTGNILRDLAFELSLDHVVAVDDLGYPADLVFRQLLGADAWLYTGLRTYLFRPMGPDTKYMRQSDPQGLIVRNVNTYDTRHNNSCYLIAMNTCGLTLLLLVPWVAAYHSQYTLAAYQLAVLTYSLY